MLRALGVILLVFALSSSGIVSAQSQSIVKPKGLTLSPLRNEFDITPGISLNGKLTVINSTKELMKVSLTAEEFSVINQQYDYAFTQESDITKWVSFDSPEIDLSAGESREIKYTIGVPLSAEPGGRYLSLFATTKTRSQTDNSVNSQQRVASLLYITVYGEVTRVGKLVSLSSPFLVSDKTNWSVLLQNTGTTHYRSRYNVQIHNIFNNKLDASSQGDALVLPNSFRLIKNDMPLPILPGLYKVVYTIGLGDNPAIVETHYIIYITPFSLSGFILFILVLYVFILFRRDLKKEKN